VIDTRERVEAIQLLVVNKVAVSNHNATMSNHNLTPSLLLAAPLNR
jgi:hypothetical protein